MLKYKVNHHGGLRKNRVTLIKMWQQQQQKNKPGSLYEVQRPQLHDNKIVIAVAECLCVVLKHDGT